MNKQTLGILALVTLVILILALQISPNNSDNNSPNNSANSALFPELNSQLENVKRIDINSPDGTFSISKNNGTWGLDSKHGYPVANDKVAQVLNGMVSLSRIEAKTKKASLHHKLALQDRSANDAKSTQVSLSTEQGKVADLLIGKTSPAKSDKSLQAMYVRLPDQAQTWLAHSPMRLEKNPDNWLDKTILKIAQKRIQSVQISPANGEAVHISKTRADEPNYQLDNLPAGAKVEQSHQLSSIANVLSNLSLDDVKPLTNSERSTERNQAQFKTFDGLSIQLDISKTDDKYWASISVQADPTANPDTLSSDKIDVVKQAADISAKTQGWLYQLPNYKMENLLKPRTELFTSADALANAASNSNAKTTIDNNALAAAFANASSQKANAVQQHQAMEFLKNLGK